MNRYNAAFVYFLVRILGVLLFAVACTALYIVLT